MNKIILTDSQLELVRNALETEKRNLKRNAVKLVGLDCYQSACNALAMIGGIEDIEKALPVKI